MNGRRALAWLAGGAVAVIVWLSWPFATALLLGALMGFTCQPVYVRLAARSRRPFLSSVAIVLTAGVLIVGSLVAFASVFFTQAGLVATAIREELRPGGLLTRWLETIMGWLDRFGFSTEALTDRLGAAAGDIASGSAAVAGTVASRTASLLLGIFFALLAMHVMQYHWARIVGTLEAVSPLRGQYTRDLLEEFRRVGRITLSGTVLTGIVQGILAGIGYSLTGVPKPLFLAIATALASLVPAVGTLLVWVPAAFYLFATGHPTMATVLLLWGALLVVGFSDYIIRPRLVGEGGMPAILTFLSLFGGLEAIGLAGLIAGPVIMALAVAVLRLYAREAKTPEADASRDRRRRAGG
ncbi:MAG TPA: AI-2E family transporter [Methylomirabilota bacterium]|nr:AI-2E family transporter [Methylomirabilota bacterium]